MNLVTEAICEKSPDKSVTTQPKQSGNGGFAIGIVGSPQFYRPGQQYEITLEVCFQMQDISYDFFDIF